MASSRVTRWDEAVQPVTLVFMKAVRMELWDLLLVPVTRLASGQIQQVCI